MPEQKQIKDMTLVELQASAYVCLANMEQWKKSLTAVETEMQKFNKPAEVTPVPEVPKSE